MKKQKQKYWLCEFFKRCGEDENTYHYIYSDKNLKEMGHEDDDNDYKILSQFFLNKITPDDQDGNSYWHFDSLVRFDGMQEVKPNEFKTLQKAGVYVNGDNLMFNYEKGQ